MKGMMAIIMLLALLVTGYLVLQNLKARQDEGASAMKVFEKAGKVGEKVDRASEAQERRLRDIVGE